MAPEKGFYEHYKHDASKDINNYTYEVIGVGLHTEDRDYYVVYRPLYKNKFLTGANFCLRPYEMFLGTVEKNGVVVPRFKKIIDEEIISALTKIRDEMYGAK
jgi:hypothetical protein